MKIFLVFALLSVNLLLFSQIHFVENGEAWNLADSNSSWGLSMIDFDNDGLLDIFISNGYVGLSQQNYLMRNLGTIFQSVTSQYNLIDFAPTTCASWGDFDNDGFIDLFTTNGSETTGANKLYRFDGNVFSDVAAAYGLSVSDFYNSVSFCNVDGNNYLDIFILGTYTTNYLYLGNEVGFTTQIVSNPEGTGYTHLFSNITGDNKPELLLANSLGSLIVYSFSNGVVSDITSEVGLGAVTKVSGMCSADIDNDGDFDLLFATNLGNTSSAISIFRNDNGTFFDVTTEMGVNISGRGKCVVELDADKDGLSDFYLGRWNNSGILLHNLGNSFEIISEDFSDVSTFPIALVAGDINNNGKQDIYQAHIS
jgi:enediyne biosynthesis protein E4